MVSAKGLPEFPFVVAVTLPNGRPPRLLPMCLVVKLLKILIGYASNEGKQVSGELSSKCHQVITLARLGWPATALPPDDAISTF
jgi:hypothetical protein